MGIAGIVRFSVPAWQPKPRTVSHPDEAHIPVCRSPQHSTPQRLTPRCLWTWDLSSSCSSAARASSQMFYNLLNTHFTSPNSSLLSVTGFLSSYVKWLICPKDKDCMVERESLPLVWDPNPCCSGEGSSQVADGAGWFPRVSWLISKPPLRPVAKGKVPRLLQDLLEDLGYHRGLHFRVGHRWSKEVKSTWYGIASEEELKSGR